MEPMIPHFQNRKSSPIPQKPLQLPSDFNLLSTHLERFINYLQYTKNASPKTIENYSLRINRFITYINDIEADQVKSIYVQDFRMFLTKQ
jgi:site-specific recombinase XerC